MSHRIVKRLLGNNNWATPAECAMDEIIDKIPTPVDKWRHTSTWAQVRMVYDQVEPEVEAELRALEKRQEPPPEPPTVSA